MWQRLARLAVAVAAVWPQLVAGQGLKGHPNCPCINPWNVEGGGVPKDLTFVDQPTGRGCLTGEGGNCFPLDYGARRCFAWDINLPPRCASQDGRPLTNAPDSCQQPWCFVAADCKLRHKASNVFRGYSLQYSYETCGAVDFFSAEVLVSTLKGKQLVAGVASNSPPMLENNGLQAPTGWTADFVNHLVHQVGASVKIEEISAESKSKYPLSTYTACARDVALGYKDICYGGFLETPERLLHTTFTPVYVTQLFYLVVPSSHGTDAGGMIAKAFDPFTPGLWVLLFFMALSVGFGMWVFGEVGNRPVVSGTLLGLQMASLQFMGHGGGFEISKTRSGSLLLFGFSFFCMMGLASYTANLANFLLMANLHTGMKNIHEAIDNDVKLCTLQAAVSMLEAAYPKSQHLLVKLPDWPSLVDAYRAEKCGAMIMPQDRLELVRAAAPPFDRHGKKGHCDMRKVGDPVLAVPIGMPISSELDHAFGYVWAREKFLGHMDHFKSLYPAPPSECEVQEGLRHGATPMGVGDLLGGLLIVIILLIASGVLFFFGKGGSLGGEAPSGDSAATILAAVAELETQLKASGIPMHGGSLGGEAPSGDSAATILAAVAELETQLKASGIPMHGGKADSFARLVEWGKENPKRVIAVVCLLALLLTVCIIIAFAAKFSGV